MSFNELAVDLTCDPEHFQPISSEADWDPERDVPGYLHPSHKTQQHAPGPETPFQVHGGMLKMARVMGGIGKPVHMAVRNALRRNKDYGDIFDSFSEKISKLRRISVVRAQSWRRNSWTPCIGKGDLCGFRRCH